MGNKGAVAASMQVRATSLCFVGSHLAARPERIHERNTNYTDILECLRLGRKEFEMTHQFHHVFWAGDLNYRVELPFEAAVTASEVVPLKSGGFKVAGLADLLAADQLAQQQSQGQCFQAFMEAPITFAPTYKCKVGLSPRVYANKRDQAPSYTDRVLYHSMPRCEGELKLRAYESADTITFSDHTPVSATFELKLRSHLRAEMKQAHAGQVGCHLRLTNLSVEPLRAKEDELSTRYGGKSVGQQGSESASRAAARQGG